MEEKDTQPDMITVVWWNDRKNHILFDDSNRDLIQSLQEILNLKKVTIETFYKYGDCIA